MADKNQEIVKEVMRTGQAPNSAPVTQSVTEGVETPKVSQIRLCETRTFTDNSKKDDKH